MPNYTTGTGAGTGNFAGTSTITMALPVEAWTTWTTNANATIAWTVWTVGLHGTGTGVGMEVTQNFVVRREPRLRRPLRVADPAPRSTRQVLTDLKRTREQRAIRARAADLLRLILTPEEWAEWLRYDSVRVRGNEGGLYEVGCGWNGMIYRLDEEGRAVQKLCIHPDDEFAIEDRVATMILALRTNEMDVRSRGNNHPLSEYEPDRVRVRRAHRLRRVA